MYKLVFSILILSGFLFYKALTLKAARKTNLKTDVTSVSLRKEAVLGKKLNGNLSSNTRAAAKAGVAAGASQSSGNDNVQSSTAKPPEQLQREEFDSLGAVYHQSEEVDETRVTPQEKEAFNTTVELMQRIEAEAASRKNGPAGKSKRPQDLTPEEQKQFEIYNQFEKKESPNE